MRYLRSFRSVDTVAEERGDAAAVLWALESVVCGVKGKLDVGVRGGEGTGYRGLLGALG